MSAPLDDRLMYGHNWEDAQLELTALGVRPTDEIIAVAGAGCTVLALLAEGPRRLHAIDRSHAQIHLLKLKLAAAIHLPAEIATAFLGGRPHSDRLAVFDALHRHLPATTASFWLDRPGPIERGVISQGRIERYFALLRPVFRCVHPRARIRQLLSQESIEGQRSFYLRLWDSPGWHRLFLLAHQRILNRVLDPSFYRYIDGRHFHQELRQRAAHCLTELPIRDNYFISWILQGQYPEPLTARPPYLLTHAPAALAQHVSRLRTHHGDIRQYLRSCAASSCDKFYLSNVSEWLPEAELAPFFEEVIRVARDGATVCYRALMIDRPLPACLRDSLHEDPARAAQLAATDRAFVNVAFHVMTVRKLGNAHARG